jgi:hypothetical protein
MVRYPAYAFASRRFDASFNQFRTTRGVAALDNQAAGSLPPLQQQAPHQEGHAQKELEDVPLYRCRACGRTFAPGPRAIRNKTYPLPEILEVLR